ncbi:MAG TPA: hypothetical protein VJ816_07735 [Gemmatimonadales bacterium]|nr:hypothetical protein [Gemmatimonadales bacterium]
MTPVLIGVVAAGVVGTIAAFAFVVERKRGAGLTEYCLMRGYHLERERPDARDQLADAFAVFRQGRHRRWRWTITGAIGGRAFTAFDYDFVTGGGNSTHRHHLGMVLWEAPEARLPRFSLAPEGFFQRLGQRFGVKDFDFVEDPEFSRAYQLQGDDEAAVRTLFTSARRAVLMAPGPGMEKPRRHHLAGDGARLLWWGNGGLPGPEDLDQFLAEGDAVRRQFLG